MAKEEKDLNKNQSVTDSGLKDQSATGQDLNQSVTGEQAETLADGDDKDKKTVKYTEFEKANKAKTAAEEEARILREQMAVIVANQTVPSNPVQAPQQPLTPYDQARTELGFSDEDYPSEADRSRIFTRATEIINANQQQMNVAQANVRFVQTHADYGEVVGRQIGNNFQLSSELVQILTEKPHLTNAVYASNEGAYKVVMQERELTKLRQENTVQGEHLEQQGIENKEAPVSGAAAAGGAMMAAAGPVTLEQQQEAERQVTSGEL